MADAAPDRTAGTAAVRFAVLMLAAALPAAAGPAAPPSSAPGKLAPGGVLLRVSPGADGTARIEPVLCATGDGYADPGTRETAAAFDARCYGGSRTYRLLFGGGHAGSLAVTASGRGDFTAEAALATTLRFGGMVSALATDSPDVGRGQVRRRRATPAERESVLAAARAAFRTAGIPRRPRARMRIGNITAVDVDGNGAYEIVADFAADDPAVPDGTGTCDLMLMIEPARGRYVTALEIVCKGNRTGEATAKPAFLDHIDLDGDGVGELIVEWRLPGERFYVVHKRRDGAWPKIYNSEPRTDRRTRRTSRILCAAAGLQLQYLRP